ncbi:MAG: hypothetical protein WBF15_12555, partial [Candidatus Sulfotelmatobacter sp.]
APDMSELSGQHYDAAPLIEDQIRGWDDPVYGNPRAIGQFKLGLSEFGLPDSLLCQFLRVRGGCRHNV